MENRSEKSERTQHSKPSVDHAASARDEAYSDLSHHMAQSGKPSATDLLPKMQIVDQHKQSPSQWTVVADLTVTMPNGNGAAEKSAALKKLAAETKGKPVTVVAQVVYNNPAYTKESKEPEHLLERYEMRNGAVTSLGRPTPSKDFAQDLTSLLKLANKEAPCKKEALVIQSHGIGEQGVQGADGSANLDNLQRAIADGLNCSVHKKLDLVDSDACIDANSAFLKKMAPLTNQFVASSEAETALGHRKDDGTDQGQKDGLKDGQNLNGAIRILLQNPELNGKSFGDAIVKSCRDNKTGVLTLANFDLKKYDAFDKALNKLGLTLADAAHDPKNKSTLIDIINHTTQYLSCSSGEVSPCQDRDIAAFAKNVEESLKTGKLIDENHKIAAAVDQLLATEKAMTSSYYGDPHAETNDTHTTYSKLGGLNTFLPASNFDVADFVRSHSMISQLLESTQAQTAEVDLQRKKTCIPHSNPDAPALAGKNGPAAPLRGWKDDIDDEVAKLDTDLKGLAVRHDKEAVEAQQLLANVHKALKTFDDEAVNTQGAVASFANAESYLHETLLELQKSPLVQQLVTKAEIEQNPKLKGQMLDSWQAAKETDNQGMIDLLHELYPKESGA